MSDVLGINVPLPLWPLGLAINAVCITLLGALMLRKAMRIAQGSTAATRT